MRLIRQRGVCRLARKASLQTITRTDAYQHVRRILLLLETLFLVVACSIALQSSMQTPPIIGNVHQLVYPLSLQKIIHSLVYKTA